MLNEKIVQLLNEQVNKEFYSAYLYLDMSNYYVDEGLDGFANWFKIQMQEEYDHAMLFMQYLQINDHKVNLETVKKPDITYANFKDPLTAALSHEQFVTASIHNIYDAAYSQKDFRTMQFLDWFVKEQGEEENNTQNLIKKFDLFANESKGLYMIDNEMGTRVYAAPSLVL